MRVRKLKYEAELKKIEADIKALTYTNVFVDATRWLIFMQNLDTFF